MLSQDQQELLLQQKNINRLQRRENRYKYLGILGEYQIVASKNLYQKLDYTKLNPEQHRMFKRVLHGLNVYSKEEVKAMHWDKKRRIIKVWKRGQKIINEWKQTISNKKVNGYLSEYFGTSPFIQGILNTPVDDVLEDYNNRIPLKNLGICYEDVILKFMSVGLLPKNFLEVK